MSSKRQVNRLARLARKAKSKPPPLQTSGLIDVIQSAWRKLGIQQERFIDWLSGRPRVHFGAACPISDLFCRKDITYLALSAQQLQWRPPPRQYHDLFDVAEKILQIEKHIGYKFRSRLLCAEALKMSGSDALIYFNGTVHQVAGNNRLALLGDRALSMVVCHKWYHTGNSSKHYSMMEQDVVTRANLALKGRELGVGESILLAPGLDAAKMNMVAETLEALLGAVFVDSNNDLEAVARVITHIGLDTHPLLQLPRMRSAPTTKGSKRG